MSVLDYFPQDVANTDSVYNPIEKDLSQHVLVCFKNCKQFLSSPKSKANPAYVDENGSKKCRDALAESFARRAVKRNDLVFRCYAQLWLCAHYRAIVSPLASVGPGKGVFPHYARLSELGFAISELAMQHHLLIDKPVIPWPTEKQINALLDEISWCQNFYFWSDAEATLERMEQAERTWQEADQKQFDAEQDRIVAARELVEEKQEERKKKKTTQEDNEGRPHLPWRGEEGGGSKRRRDEEEAGLPPRLPYAPASSSSSTSPAPPDPFAALDPFRAVRRQVKERKVYIRNWPFLSLSLSKQKQELRKVLCAEVAGSGHEDSGFLFSYRATDLQRRVLCFTTNLFAQYWCEEDLVRRYSFTEQRPEVKPQWMENLKKWLAQHVGYEQSEELLDVIQLNICEYTLPIGGMGYMFRDSAYRPSDVLMSTLCGHQLARKSRTLVPDDATLQTIATNLDHPLFDYVLMAKLDHVWNAKWTPVQEGEEDTDDEQEGESEYNQKRKVFAFVDRFIIPFSSLLKIGGRQDWLDQEGEFETNTRLREKGIDPEKVEKWDTAQRLPLMIYLTKRWFVHFKKKWVGVFKTFKEALLVWMWLVKQEYTWVLPDHTDLKAEFGCLFESAEEETST